MAKPFTETTMPKVTMNLSDQDMQRIEHLRDALDMSTNTGTVTHALKISALVVDGLNKGRRLMFVDDDGRPVAQVLIPGISPGI